MGLGYARKTAKETGMKKFTLPEIKQIREWQSAITNRVFNPFFPRRINRKMRRALAATAHLKIE